MVISLFDSLIVLMLVGSLAGVVLLMLMTAVFTTVATAVAAAWLVRSNTYEWHELGVVSMTSKYLSRERYTLLKEIQQRDHRQRYTGMP